jgi:plastocyanin
LTTRSLPWLILLLSSFLVAQDATVQGMVNVVHHSRSESGSADALVWLTPNRIREAVSPAPTARLLQKDKRFTPHMLAVTVGTAIEFPNQDPFFHDVFSIYHGKPFDLGLYESGVVRKVRFTQPGVSYIFCNIHPDMSAVVITLTTPYFAVTARNGSFRIPHVPPGHYQLAVWYELASESDLSSLAREVEINAGDVTLPSMTLHASDATPDHLNKYGEPYPIERPSQY